MFFYVSKILWIAASPSNLLLLLLIFGVAALFTRFARAGRRVLVASVLLFALASQLPFGVWLLRPLEDRFPRPSEDMAAPAGIIVLGGGVDERISMARGTVEMSDAGSRMTEAVALMNRFPQARLVFSGGSAAFIKTGGTESDVARRLFSGLGVAPERILYEDRSRNTWENAVFTRELVQATLGERKPGETWLLVTSGFHMPRSMGVFRQAGFPVTAYPVNYSTTGSHFELVRPTLAGAEGLRMTERALREYVGLLAYRLSGRTDAFFPGP